MGQISLQIPQLGQPVSSEDPKIASDLTTLQNVINGSIDASNVTAGSLTTVTLAAAINQAAGLNDGSNVRRGKSIVATTESRTSTAYGLMTTPDRVQNIVMPASGLIVVAYQATWQESVATAARAGLFLGSNQVRFAENDSTSTKIVETNLGGAANTDKPLSTFGAGLNGYAGGDTNAYPGDATTGQLVAMNGAVGGAVNLGGPCYIFAAAGVYDVSIQFKAGSGSVTVKNRKLWVWTLGF